MVLGSRYKFVPVTAGFDFLLFANWYETNDEHLCPMDPSELASSQVRGVVFQSRRIMRGALALQRQHSPRQMRFAATRMVLIDPLVSVGTIWRLSGIFENDESPLIEAPNAFVVLAPLVSFDTKASTDTIV